jgi:hypothetical protein
MIIIIIIAEPNYLISFPESEVRWELIIPPVGMLLRDVDFTIFGKGKRMQSLLRSTKMRHIFHNCAFKWGTL